MSDAHHFILHFLLNLIISHNKVIYKIPWLRTHFVSVIEKACGSSPLNCNLSFLYNAVYLFNDCAERSDKKYLTDSVPVKPFHHLEG